MTLEGQQRAPYSTLLVYCFSCERIAFVWPPLVCLTLPDFLWAKQFRMKWISRLGAIFRFLFSFTCIFYSRKGCVEAQIISNSNLYDDVADEIMLMMCIWVGWTKKIRFGFYISSVKFWVLHFVAFECGWYWCLSKYQCCVVCLCTCVGYSYYTWVNSKSSWRAILSMNRLFLGNFYSVNWYRMIGSKLERNTFAAMIPYHCQIRKGFIMFN